MNFFFACSETGLLFHPEGSYRSQGMVLCCAGWVPSWNSAGCVALDAICRCFRGCRDCCLLLGLLDKAMIGEDEDEEEEDKEEEG